MIKQLFKKKLDLYNSINELPIGSWFEIHRTNDLSYLMKERHSINKKQQDQLESTWNNIFFEFLDAFGIPDNMREILELRRDISVLKLEMFIENDPSIQTFIEVKEIQLNNLLNDTKKEDSAIVSAYVEKFMGFKLPKETTVKEFYSYIKIIDEEIKRSKKALKNG
jgi:hypothetical protein